MSEAREENNEQKDSYPKRRGIGGIGTGIAIGIGVGIAMDNIAIGVGVGVAMGVGFEIINRSANKKRD